MAVKALAGFILFVALSSVAARACVCVEGVDYFGVADAVFLGEVTRVEGQQISFKVVKSWKYVRTRQVRVIDFGDGSCQSNYEPGAMRLVYAGLREGALYTHMCSGPSMPTDIERERAILDSRLALQLTSEAPPGFESGDRAPAVAVGLAVAVLGASVAAGAMLHRVRSRGHAA